MSLRDEILDEALFIVIALFLAYGIYHTVGLALGTSIPVVAVTSGSMEPELQRGDLIIVQGKPFDEIERRDIIVYETEYMDVPIIHRVIERTNATLETKGDANSYQVSFCVRESAGFCPQGWRPAQTSDGPVCVRPTPSNCPDGEVVNVEKGITDDQVMGTAAFVVPELGKLKLWPTCTYLHLTGQVPADSSVCPT